MLKVKDQSAQAQPKKYYTVEEYLALEEKAEYKSEYYQGEIFGMAGASLHYNRVVRNLGSELNMALKNSKCEVFVADVRLRIETKDLFTYPDLMIVCGKPEFYKSRNDTITNPLLIVEVLSEATQSYDRNEKFRFYQSIPTLREYLMIDQYKIHIEQYTLNDDGKWVLTEYNDAGDTLRCTSVKFQIRLQEIYNKVEFEKG